MRKTVGCLLVVALLPGIMFGSAQLPPEILADQYLLQADRQISDKDHEGALESLQKILALQKEHGLTLPGAFHFKYAQVAFAAGSFPAASDSVNQYLVVAGRDGEFYQNALELLLAIKAAADRTPCDGQPKGAECWLGLVNQADCFVWTTQFEPYQGATWTGVCSGGVAQGSGSLKWAWDVGDTLYKAEEIETPSAPQLRAGTPSVFRGEPTCDGQPKGAECWLELANQPGCYVWNEYLTLDETMTWSAECVEGLAQGTGTHKQVWGKGKKMTEATGLMQEGRRHGAWVVRESDGGVWEAPYEDGKRHGQAVFRIAGGGVGGGALCARETSWPLGLSCIRRGKMGGLIHRG